MFETFTPMSALAGGALIGASASLLLLSTGRIAGISGILGGVVQRPFGGNGWRWAFIGGLVVGGLLLHLVWPAAWQSTITPGAPALVVGGLIVGFGTRMGSGCTSGHGICGLARLSPRSLAAVLVFMSTGFLTATSLARLGVLQ